MTHTLSSPHGKIMTLDTPKIMGVLNVTPDSFSDGGRFLDERTMLSYVEAMISWGVDIIDIGGESTRPNASMVSTDEELNRVLPAVLAIRQAFGDDVWLSLDTSSPEVMQAGILAGADMVNDVRGLGRSGAPLMVAKLNCPVVIMHSRGEPHTMNDLATYDDVVSVVIHELHQKVSCALMAGVSKHHIIIDVGMGFAKAHEHHITLMQHLDKIIADFNLPMLFGVSRKRFLGEVLGQFAPAKDHSPTDRDVIGTVAHLLAIQKGASIVRVHEVAMMAQALAILRAVNP